ncbi:MAG: hypothetical protein M9899_02430 [Bdellovibrionaceae bacterium]|nr:hypothetical protein [Pseudobdellovibrionaceae bacterium]
MWDSKGRPAVKKNPRRCYSCHSGGRPIHTSIPTRDIWPFIHPNDIENSRQMELVLSKLNRDFQFRLMENKEFPRWWVDLLSLNVRPNNYELSAETLKALQVWSRDLSLNTPVPERSWFDFLDWF